MVDQSMASLLGPGTVSELNYGNRLVATVMGVIALTVSRVAFPAFSRMAAEERFSELRGSLKRFATLTVFLSAPAVIVLSYGSEFVVNATFRRGQFTWETAERVSLIQSMFALQIPFYLVGGLFARAASALEMNRMVLAVGSGAIVANILLNGALIGPLGAPGLALATTIVYVGTCLGMGMVLRSRLGALEARQRGKSSETLRAAA
jgi:putative peptidoglycan lipid II flippase